jgi:hypothetical protein
MTVFSLLVRGTSFFLGQAIPIAFGTVLSMVVTLTSGGWFFSTRAEHANGQALGWRGGIPLTGLAFVLFSVTGLLLAVAFRILLPRAVF